MNPRTLWALLLFFVVHLFSLPAQAQSPLTGLDSHPFPLPIASGPFTQLESTQPFTESTWSLRFRQSYVARPLQLRLPSPSIDGTQVSAIEGQFISELSGSKNLGAGFDVGIGLGLHSYQWGSGLSSVTGGASLPTVALADPRLALGWSHNYGSLQWRPYGVLSLPLGSRAAFSSDGSVRAELGVAASWLPGRFHLGLDAALRLHPNRQLGHSSFGSGLKLGLGALYQISPIFSGGVELLCTPFFSTSATSENAESLFILPAEARALVRARFAPWSFGASVGSGLPLSQSPNSSSHRALTSPLLRGLLEATLEL